MPSLRVGDTIRDTRDGSVGTFNHWKLLIGRRCAFVIAGKRRWYVPEANVFEVLHPSRLKQKRAAHLWKYYENGSGERNRRALLTADEVREIRRRYDAKEKLDSIARDFPVCKGVVSRIGRRQAWRKVKDVQHA